MKIKDKNMAKSKIKDCLLLKFNIFKIIFFILISNPATAQNKIVVGSGIFPVQQNFDSSKYYQKTQVNALLPVISAGQNTTVSASGNIYTVNSQASAASNTVTERKIYYHQEFIPYRNIDTTTGAITMDSSQCITGYIPIEGNTSIRVYNQNPGESIIIYGWTYDSSLNPISAIRSSVYSKSVNRSYGNVIFTTPSNARYIVLLASSYGIKDFSYMRLRVTSNNTITYNTPITPEQFTGTQTQQIQKAVNFAAWTTSGVLLNGVYGLDSAIILPSGTHITLNNTRIFRNVGMHDNFFRNEAVATQSNIFWRGNKNITIQGVGNAIIEGSNEAWGSDSPTGVGTQYWKAQDILFGNVDGFEVSGLTFKATNAAAFYTEQCRNGNVFNLNFLMGLEQKNQGGLAFNSMSHNINVHDIRGTCQDDFFAVYDMGLADSTDAILGSPLTSPIYEPFRTDRDTYDIIATNLQRSPSTVMSGGGSQFWGSAIRIQCTNGLKIRNITIDNVTGNQNFLIYSANSYGPMYAGTINNLMISNTNGAAIYVSKGISNASFINVALTDTAKAYLALVIPDTSYNVVRKYYGQPTEYIDSVMGGVTYKSVANKVSPNAMTSAQRSALTGLTKGREVFCTDCTANDASTGVGQMWTGSAWKNEW